MLARSLAATPWGTEASAVEVEAEVQCGRPSFQILGLAGGAARESKERIRAALKSAGFDLPPRAIVVNLAPADLPKEARHLDLAVALALLAASGQLPREALHGRLVSGELALDGSVRPVRGGLAIACLGARLGLAEVVLPLGNAAEAAALRALPVIGVQSLAEAFRHVRGLAALAPAAAPSGFAAADTAVFPDLVEVRGQEGAKHALEVAASGGHSLLMVGPAGSGKTLLARCLPGLLPPLTPAEAIEVAKIHSFAGESPHGLLRERPFRAPPANLGVAALLGSGALARPGEVSLAHRGVLFVDGFADFRRSALESLREPLEEGEVTVRRQGAPVVMPARFSLVATARSCPCGHLGDAHQMCRCTPACIARYRTRLGAPLLDRIDLQVEVPALTLRELRSASCEGSNEVAARVAAARDLQARRFGLGAKTPTNAAMTPAELARHCALDAPGQALLEAALKKLGLSASALDRVLKVARTIADLAGGGPVRALHFAEALQYRSLDRRIVEQEEP